MELTPTETDRLLLYLAASLARARKARGLALNVPETIAIVADTVAEAARDGLRVTEALERGRAVLGPDDVLPGVADIVTAVQVEAVFSDGSRLVTVPNPIGSGHLGGDAPGAITTGTSDRSAPFGDDEVIVLEVTNEASVPISVTSHFHFFEVNPRLRFDRAAAYGHRLAVPAGAVVRFDPATPTSVTLTPITGGRTVVGFAGLVDGPLDGEGVREEALARLAACGFADTGRSANPDAVARAVAAHHARSRAESEGSTPKEPS